MKKIKLRLAELKDLESIVDFQQKMAIETEGKELSIDKILNGVKSVLNNINKGFYLVACDEDKPVASLMVTKEWSDWRSRCLWYSALCRERKYCCSKHL